MYPNNFFMPGYNMGFGAPTSLGFLGKSKGIFSGIKSINWGSLLGNASKALGVVNQAVPLVKQAGPMFNNMKSMIKLASAFKDETDDNSPRKKETKIIKKEPENITTYQTNNYNNTPNFFL